LGQNQYFDFTSKLFQWRKTNEAVHFGKMTHYIPENNVYVYFRYTDNKTVMVLMNNSNEIKLSKLPVSGKQGYTTGKTF
jgi:glycosidase